MNLHLILVARSKQLLVSDSYQPLDIGRWESELQASAVPALGLAEIAQYLSAAPGAVVLVDNTSSQTVAESYPLFLRQGISVVTPNKKAFSGSLGLWRDIYSVAGNGDFLPGFDGDGDDRQLEEKLAGLVFHESSVGAGLPIISTLKDLVGTGDEVKRIEGVFSGTLSFLFNNFMPLEVEGEKGKFSEEVKKAKDLGYTEPDPREDLNGLDVARKLTILARLVGLDVESPTSFPVQSLVPKDLEDAPSAEEYLAKLSQYDDEMEKLRDSAASEGKVLRYVGSIDVGKKELTVGLQRYAVNAGSSAGRRQRSLTQ